MGDKKTTQRQRTRFPRPRGVEREFEELEFGLARQLAGELQAGGQLGQFRQASQGLAQFLQDPFSLPPNLEALLQQRGQQSLGNLLGGEIGAGRLGGNIAGSTITGGAIGGLASGLVGQRAAFAQQNLSNLLTLQQNALRNRLSIQQAVAQPLNRLQSVRLQQPIVSSTVTQPTNVGSVVGGVVGAGLGGLLGNQSLF